ncbi:MAG: hypothetical protein ABFS32_14915 [Bacteroidota bacterium]
MTRYEQKKIDVEFSRFARMNFDKPQNCRNIGQIRYYMDELTIKMKELKSSFNYVPDFAHALLTQYNDAQNHIIHRNFKNVYC